MATPFWTLDTYAERAAAHGLPALAAFFAACKAGRIPNRVPARLPVGKLRALAEELAAQGVVFHDMRPIEARYAAGTLSTKEEEAATAIGWNGDNVTHPWIYRGPHGGHPALASLTHAICLAAVDSCCPAASWRVRRVFEPSEVEALFAEEDDDDDIMLAALSHYPMLATPEIVIAERCASFIDATENTNRYWAVGIAAGDILLGLNARISGTGAGTRILEYWKASRNYLIAHNVLNVPYFARHGFAMVPCPAEVTSIAMLSMCWNIDPVLAMLRLQELGLSWEPDAHADAEAAMTSPRLHQHTMERWAAQRAQTPTPPPLQPVTDVATLPEAQRVISELRQRIAYLETTRGRHPAEVRFLLTPDDARALPAVQAAIEGMLHSIDRDAAVACSFSVGLDLIADGALDNDRDDDDEE